MGVFWGFGVDSLFRGRWGVLGCVLRVKACSRCVCFGGDGSSGACFGGYGSRFVCFGGEGSS